jgi:hypothetical protein
MFRGRLHGTKILEQRLTLAMLAVQMRGPSGWKDKVLLS